MADIERMKSALRNAHKAGDTEAAKKIARAIKQERGHTDVPEFDPGVEGYNPGTGLVEPTSSRTSTAAFGALEGVPVAGPYLAKGAEHLASGVGTYLTGEDRDEVRSEMREMRERGNEKHPGTRLAANVGGAVASTAPVAATALGGRLLGVTGQNLAKMSAASGGSNAAISAADTAARGGGREDIVQSGLIGGGLGLVLPGASRAVGAGSRAAGSKVASAFRSASRPTQEASKRVAKAVTTDRANAAVPLLGPADEASARLNQQRLLNVDRGGETTRALARATSNAAPEARAVIEREASDRFASQGSRVSNMLARIAGGTPDDLALQDSLKNAAKAYNRPAYRKAYQEGAELTMTPEMERLTSSPAVVRAMKTVAEGRGKDRAVAEGFGSFNPRVTVTDDGRIAFNRVQPGGGTTAPDLQFWDYVKRELDGMASTAARGGDNDAAGTIGNLARTLRGELDSQVPSYAAARQGASRFFGAEDAIDAGRKFASTTRNTPEMKRAFGIMSAPEKKAFQVGYASELVDKVKSTNDRTNVIRGMFGSEEAREKLLTVFGPGKAKEIEAFVRVENAMDMLRGALGNSTTTRQLVEMGLVGGGTYAVTGGDLSTSTIAALAAGGARFARGKANDRVMKEVARILVSDDPALLERAIKNAALSPAHMKAVEGISRFVATLPTARTVATGQSE